MPKSRERILSVGTPGSGKTRNYFSVIEWLKDTGAKFYVLDTDDTVARFLEAPHFAHLDADRGGPLVHLPAFNWKDVMKHTDTINQWAQSGDWVMIDMANMLWEMVQEHFVKEVFKKDYGDFMLMARQSLKKDAKSMQALDGWKDWNVINAMYKDVMNDLLYRSPAHAYLCTSADKVSDEDDKLTKQIFGVYGVKPGGQKHLGHQAQTILLTTRNRDGEHFLTTIKDRERKQLVELRIPDTTTAFAKQYLMAVAGWRK